MITESEAFDFAEWCNLHYVRLHGGWKHKFSMGFNNDLLSTEQLFKIYKKAVSLFEQEQDVEFIQFY